MPPKKVVKRKEDPPVHIVKFENETKEFKPNDNIEIDPKGWVLPNRVKFPKWIRDTFQYKGKSQQQLFPSQRFVKDYIQLNSPYRGILLFHALGLGKSCASIVATENLIAEKDVVILLPASLKRNYIEEIKNKCGNKFFSKEQHWLFLPLKDIKSITTDISKRLFVDIAFINANQGVWIPTKNETSNWNSLTDMDKQVINEQLDNMIKNKYTFISYNGLQGKHIDKMITDAKPNNPFDNKVIIVDEVHNLISRTVGSGRIGKRIYELVLKSVNSKLILLSGTPLINYPHELSLVINLLKGLQYIYKLEFTDKLNRVAIESYLEEHPYVDNYDIDIVKKILTLQLAPRGFVFSNKKEYLLEKDNSNVVHNNIISEIASNLSCKVKGPEDHLLLPVEREVFNDKFIDFNTETIVNPRLLSRRLMGCISYFGTYNSDVYPKRHPTEVIDVFMSDHQFNKYEADRFTERQKEERAKKKARGRKETDIFSSTGQVYRAYSRALCNFVFPTEIERPYPGKLKFIYREMDIIEGDLPIPQNEVKADEEVDEIEANVDQQEGGSNKKKLDSGKAELLEKAKEYNRQIQECLTTLAKNYSNYLTIPKRGTNYLEMLSPKFSVLVPKLNSCVGKALVYSQFRTVEGLGVLSLVLNANDWTEFKIKTTDNGSWELDIDEKDMKKKKYFQYRGDEEQTNMLMKIFNNDLKDLPDGIKSGLKKMMPKKTDNPNNLYGELLKLIMITQSGAEGISLKHVREVHILEPYWNEIRIEQVIGRAVRANSHIDLPKNEQDVRVYRYIAKMTKKQIKSSKTIQNKDLNMTTDEYIYDIAQRKSKIINTLQDIMKASSVDCLVHKQYHDNVKCLEFPVNVDGNLLSYQIDLEKEETDFEYKQKTRTRKQRSDHVFRKCSINDVQYAYDTNSNILYDLSAYQNGRLVKLGTLVKDLSSGKMKLVR